MIQGVTETQEGPNCIGFLGETFQRWQHLIWIFLSVSSFLKNT